MPFFIAAAALAIAASQAVAPPAPPTPPPVVITPTAPPAPPSPSDYRRMMDRLAQPPAILDVRVSAEGGVLWQGSLRVSTAPAAVREERSEAEPGSCRREGFNYSRPVRTSFSLGLTSVRTTDQDDLFGFNLEWTRLPKADACASEGSRTVQLQTTVAIPAHGSATLHGDAGLTVEIHRH